ncbi:HAMP domain-containing sensor histidine kinase [Allopusillimonas ginsengisoli]|uniref:sensor histidine kinase n=1 Tax=Allopusillimonas ginsengisoli TaxID=453575 RepID=UPI00269AF528
MQTKTSRPQRRDPLLPKGSLARHLVWRLLPAVFVLVAIDLTATWLITRKMSLQEWLLRDIFWTMVISQIVLVTVFAWVLIKGVRSGLASMNRLSSEISQRSIEDLQPLDVTGLPAEVAPLVSHLNDLLLRLDDSMQAQKRFIGHAAHQLRTPLTGLKLESELMLTRTLPDDVRARAERIKSVTDRMIRLGQQLLVLARVDSSTRPQDSFKRMDLAEWVRETAAEWIPSVRSTHLEIQLSAPREPVWVDIDPLLLEELLGNLIDNAVRYAKDATVINLRVTTNPPTLAVEDDGQGIAPEDAAHVFDAFYRSARPANEGSGLGLAIVREIARAHGAWWGLSTRPEFQGTRITVIFPGPRIGAKLTRQE